MSIVMTVAARVMCYLGSLVILAIGLPADYLARMCDQAITYLRPGKMPRLGSFPAGQPHGITVEVVQGRAGGHFSLVGFVDQNSEISDRLDQALLEAVTHARIVDAAAKEKDVERTEKRAAQFSTLFATAPLPQLSLHTADGK